MKKLLAVITFLAIVLAVFSFTQYSEIQQLNSESQKLKDEILGYQMEITRIKNPPQEPVRIAAPYCLNKNKDNSLEEYKKEFAQNTFILEEEIENFFSNKELQDLVTDRQIFQVCYFQGGFSFVAYADIPETDFNNVIGVYNYQEAKLHTDTQQNQGGGDIGLCRIDGNIEGHLLYSCGGGDAGWWHNTVYVLNKDTGKVTKIKECSANFEEHECKVDLLDLDIN